MNKYHAVKTKIDGITFDSMKEAVRYQELKLLEKAGIITELELQVPYTLIPTQKISGKTYRKAVYKADFRYKENNRIVVEDVKGMKTAVYKLKKLLMYEKYGIEIYEI
jgi:hypothetical protein